MPPKFAVAELSEYEQLRARDISSADIKPKYWEKGLRFLFSDMIKVRTNCVSFGLETSRDVANAENLWRREPLVLGAAVLSKIFIGAGNIARNEAVMRALGLGTHDVGLHQAAKQQRAPRKRAADAPKREPTRRSNRVAGLEANGSLVDASGDANDADDAELSDAHALELRDHLRWAGRQRKSIVGSASYEHTLMRVRSMTEPKLWQRMRVIEKAKGQNAVVKCVGPRLVCAWALSARIGESERTATPRRMRLFARVCFLEDMSRISRLFADEREREKKRALAGDIYNIYIHA